jgi:hypothetical protein
MKKHSIQQVALIVEYEGLGYAIQDYMSGDSIEDPELAKMWDECQKLMNKIEDVLRPHYTE